MSAAIFSAHGRSPGSRGLSVARTAALRASERLGGAASALSSARGHRRGGCRSALRRRGAPLAPTLRQLAPRRAREIAARSSPRAGAGSARLGERAHHRDPPRAGLADRVDVRRRRCRRSRRTGRWRARRRSARARARRPVGRVWSASRGRGRRRCSRRHARGAVDLLGAVGRKADDPVGADGRPGVGHRDVVLADVDAVRAGRLDQIGSVVEDEQRAVLRRRSGEPASGGDDLVVVGVLHPQLDDVHAAAQHRAQELVGLLGADQVEASGSEAFMAVGHASQCGTRTATGCRPPAR